YDSLILSGGGAKANIGPLTVNDDLTIGAGTPFNAGSFTNSVYGDWINNGLFTAGTSTIQLLGNQDSIITGVTTFNTLTLNKISAAALVTLEGNNTVTTLNMSQGNIHTRTNSVTITSDRTGPG